MRTRNRFPFAIAAALAVTACGNGLPGSQLAARVNGQDIGFGQIGLAEPPAEGIPPSAMDNLERAIDRELLTQKALEKHLDRDPGIQADIEDARRRILAKAYLDRNMTETSVSTGAVQDFYRAHPLLFSERRIFQTQTIIAVADAKQLAGLGAVILGGAGLDDIAAWLGSRHIELRRENELRPSEQIPALSLRRLADLRPGQIVAFENEGVVTITQLQQSLPAPFNFDEARPLIEQMLAEQKRNAFAQLTASQLRTNARIEYLGPFAEARSKTPQPAAPRTPVAGKDDAHLAKGLSGLL